MAFDTGIPKIDRLLSDPAEPALAEGATRLAEVGIVHDLINRFDPDLAILRPLLPKAWKRTGRAALPSFDSYEIYSPKTAALVRAFQKHAGLPESGTVNHATLAALLAARRAISLITPAELIFTHGLKHSHFLKALVLTGGRECNFDYGVMNLNTDKAGLSIGILHWAQRPGRLGEMIELLHARSPVLSGIVAMDLLFGGEAEMQRVITHLKLGKDGLNRDGTSTDPTLEFSNQPMVVRKYWPHCFSRLMATTFAQSFMVDFAMKTFRKLYDSSYAGYPGNVSNLTGRNLKGYAPKLKSQRAVIFGLDMINQHGGNTIAFYNAATADAEATEEQILLNMRDEAANSWLDSDPPTQTQLKNAAADTARRNFFINTPNLSSAVDFDPA